MFVHPRSSESAACVLPNRQKFAGLQRRDVVFRGGMCLAPPRFPGMADFRVIRDVSVTLRDLLTDALAGLVPATTCVLNDLSQPIGIPPPSPILTLTLYDAIEDSSARNRPNVRVVRANRIAIKRPQIALLLRYLVTPWSGQPESDHQILGRAVQALYDNAIISGRFLHNPSSLFDAQEALKVTMVPLSLEDRTHVWRSVDQPYRLSANYEVRVVQIESLAEREVAMARTRRLDFGEVEDSP